MELHNIIPEARKGKFKISHFSVTEKEARATRMRSLMSLTPGEYCDFRAGDYIRLIDTENRKIVMSNTPMEVETNMSVIDSANGDVLIAGLGLGMILLKIQDKKEVRSVLVLEKHQDIIDLVWPYLKLDDRFSVVNSDIFDYHPGKGEKFDTIYFDIWNNISSDNWDDMKKLHYKFRYRLNRSNPKAWMSSWRKWYTERLYREWH